MKKSRGLITAVVFITAIAFLVVNCQGCGFPPASAAPTPTRRPMIVANYQPPKVNGYEEAPFCDGARAVVWDNEDIFANLDEGWEGYFRHEAETDGKEYAEERARNLLRKSVFPNICNQNHWKSGEHKPINADNVSQIGYFYWPDVIVQ